MVFVLYTIRSDKESISLSALGRQMLFEGTKQYFEKNYQESDIAYSTYNKPYFKDQEIKFNLSHSGNVIVCALSNTEDVGIDIEKILPKNVADFRSLMTDSEWDRILMAKNSLNTFFIYWTEKEAVLKAHGDGLALPLKSFEVIDKVTTIKDKKFYMQEIEIHPEYICHLALSKAPNKKTIFIRKL